MSKDFNEYTECSEYIDEDTFFTLKGETGHRQPKEIDHINPEHYKSHPSGIECIQVTEHMTFCIGNAIKYLWRAGLKGDRLEDLEKAKWYIEREISRTKRVKSL